MMPLKSAGYFCAAARPEPAVLLLLLAVAPAAELAALWLELELLE